MAKVGQKTDVPRRRMHQVSHRIASVVRDGKSIHRDIAHFKGAASGENPGVDLNVQLSFDGFLGQAVAINGQIQFRRQSGQTGYGRNVRA
jgi:hypothetical protein